MNRAQRRAQGNLERKIGSLGPIPPKPAEPIYKQEVMIPVAQIVLTNKAVSRKRAMNLAKSVPPEDWPPVCAYEHQGRYYLSDGNHRATAARIKHYKTIKAILLTQEEYDYVKMSNRTLDTVVQRFEANSE